MLALISGCVLTQTLLKNPKSFPFREPVNAVGLGVPTYFNVVLKPMDLGTVKVRRLRIAVSVK